MNDENLSLKREKEQLQEQLERGSLGRREQGPQAAKDEIAAQLLAENERLKAKYALLEAQDPRPLAREIPRYTCTCM